LTLSGTFFKTEYSKRIDFIGSGYKQVAGGYSQGAELEASWQPIENLKLSMSYTRTFAEAGGRSITGIPRNLWGLNFDWMFLNRFRYNLDLTYKGKEQITIFSIPSFTSEFIDQESYTKVDMKLSFDLNDTWDVWVRGDNLFDAEFLEDGFRNPGAQFFGGVSMEV
jgi:outer membrane receptor for ferrienterochelin and colicin